MASAGEESAAEISGGRRTRSGRILSATQQQPLASPTTRSTRRSVKQKPPPDQLAEHETPEIINELDEEQELYAAKQRSSDLITEMLAEAAQGVINSDGGTNVMYEEHVIETVEGDDVIEQVVQQYDDCIVYEEQGDEQDVEMYQEHLNNAEAPAVSETGLDDKSSSFPFGTVGQSETSEEAQNETHHTEMNEGGAAESSLLASLAGDNANSLPSVGGAEDADSKRENFEAKMPHSIQQHCDKMESDDSFSEPAIAEDIGGGTGGADGSDATIVNTEMVSEDELPLPTKPEINDAEEVSDDELPAPQRAELPADAEVISEDELPASDKKSSQNVSPEHVPSPAAGSEKLHHKRKAHEALGARSSGEGSTIADKKPTKSAEKHDEQYNPMSPTSESNEPTTPPIEKKLKLDSSNSEGEHKERKKERERERERDKTKEKEKDRDRESERDSKEIKDKDKERDKEKERKKLPDLDKYWRAVREDSTDFTGWTYLLQYVDNESDAEAAREAYDEFLAHYPYCYGYWRKYADYEKRKGVKANCNAVFERGLEAIPLSVDLWIHYLAHVRNNNHAENNSEAHVRAQFERAIDACGLEFRSDKLWDAYIKWETEAKRYQRVLKIYDRLLSIPTQGYSGHFDSFQDFINQHAIGSIVTSEELHRIRSEMRDAVTARAKSSGGGSKSPAHHHKDDAHIGPNTTTADEATMSSAGDAAVVAPPPGDNLPDASSLSDSEISAIRDKVIAVRRKQHKVTVAAVTARWTYEEGIKRPYFHVKPLERCQLKNWRDYLDFEIELGDRQRILVLFERCLIACALYDEFWVKMLRYLDTQLDQPNVPALASHVYRRACQIHHPDKPSLHLMWTAFEECQGNFDGAAEILLNLEKKCPHLLQVAYRRINVERRRGDLAKCRQLYEHYIAQAKNKTLAGSLAIKYARFLNKIDNDLDGGLRVLRQALDKDAANTRVALQMIDLALQRNSVDEDEVVLIMDRFMSREQIDPEQKVLFAQRKVEFLEDFGSTARGLQEAQRALQSALGKANETKKKRECSPGRKSSLSASSANNNSAKDGAGTLTAPTAAAVMASSSSYNNGAAATAAANYNYNSVSAASAAAAASYYSQQGGGGAYQQQQQQYDGYYNHWQYGSGGNSSGTSGYSGYGQWNYGNNYY